MLNVHLIPLDILELLQLETHDFIRIGVFLSSTKRRIKHLRRLQLDTTDSINTIVRDFTWKMRHINNRNKIDLYYKDGRNERYPNVNRANYIAQEPVKREILSVHKTPGLIAIYKIKILEPIATFSVIGNLHGNPTDEGISVLAGFGKNETVYSPENDNLNIEGASIEIKT